MFAVLTRHRRVVILLAVVLVAVAVTSLEAVQDAVGLGLEAAAQLMQRHRVGGLFLFVLLSVVSAIAFFFSSAVIVPVAVYAWGKLATVLLLWGSWLLGAAVSYWLGRHAGRPVVRWFVPVEQLERYEDQIAAKASFPLVLLFQIAVPSEIPGLVLGTLRYSFGRYLLARAIAEVPFAVGAVYLGDTFVRRQHVLLLAIAVGGILLSALALHFLHKRLER